MKQSSLFALLLLVAVLAACTDSGNRRTDPAAAQQLQPRITGYTSSSADSIVDAITAAGAAASLSGGNVPAAAAIAKAESVVQCLQDRGAVDATTYVETTPSGIVPQAGVSIIINQTRVNQDLLNCLTTGQTEGITAQAVTIEPCTGSGSFTYRGSSYSYLYVGVGDQLCGFFAQHFASLKAGS